MKPLKAMAREGSLGPLLEGDVRGLNRVHRTIVISREALTESHEIIRAFAVAGGLYVFVAIWGQPNRRPAGPRAALRPYPAESEHAAKPLPDRRNEPAGFPPFCGPRSRPPKKRRNRARAARCPGSPPRYRSGT